MCGGTRHSHLPDFFLLGLSPRVRGNPAQPPPAGFPGRSIPACAGEPLTNSIPWRRSAVYPRVCGGTELSPRPRTACRGLSPRVRGNRLLIAPFPDLCRSIPACAGEPPWRWPRSREERVYPRVCGGTYQNIPAVVVSHGLSPRVRGNRRQGRQAHGQVRSIPACAGEPTIRTDTRQIRQVYPRVCGGTWNINDHTELEVGLSPRVRGNPQHPLSSNSSYRSIPACAGEPAPQTGRSSTQTVYPRVCGGTPLPG